MLKNKESYKIAVLGLMLTLCLLVTYYCHFILKIETIFTHLFYVPIIFASLWWYRKGIAVAVFLAIALLILNFFSPLENTIWTNAARSFMFIVVGATVAVLNKKKQILGAKLQEYCKTLEQWVDERTKDLKEAQEKQRAILDGIGDAVVVLNSNLNILWANETASKQYGSVTGKQCFEEFEWLEKPSTDHLVSKTYADGLVNTIEKEGVLKDGIRINFIANSSPVRDMEGNVVSVVVIFHDISERKTAEKEREKLITELKESLVKVKTLSGLLPICASCKKIRDDKGYWHKVEEYIHDHSEVEFTHGLCPDCSKKLYPDYYKNGDENK
jgi:PAS domain S-box-containing protein